MSVDKRGDTGIEGEEDSLTYDPLLQYESVLLLNIQESLNILIHDLHLSKQKEVVLRAWFQQWNPLNQPQPRSS